MEICIEPTNICSANCTFCGYGKGEDSRPKGFLSNETTKSIVKLLSKRKLKQHTISLTTPNGDVTCYPYLIELIKMINSHGYRVGFYTNGIRLGKLLPDLTKLNISNINVSFMVGNPELYRQTFGVDKYFTVLFNIMQLGLTSIPTKILLRQSKTFDYKKSPDYFRLLCAFGEKKISALERWGDRNGLITLNDLPEGHTFYTINHSKRIPCYQLHKKMLIQYNGEISICNCRTAPELDIGYLNDGKICIDQRLITIRRNWWLHGVMPDICITCNHYHSVLQQFPRIVKRRLITLLRPVVKCLTSS